MLTLGRLNRTIDCAAGRGLGTHISSSALVAIVQTRFLGKCSCRLVQGISLRNRHTFGLDSREYDFDKMRLISWRHSPIYSRLYPLVETGMAVPWAEMADIAPPWRPACIAIGKSRHGSGDMQGTH